MSCIKLKHTFFCVTQSKYVEVNYAPKTKLMLRQLTRDNIKPVRTREQMLRHAVSGQIFLMCLDKSQSVPQQISCADTRARL
jgi:hypothetical protein